VCYQSGPAGGGISNPVNPLMHWACEPWPTCSMYWRRRHIHKLNTLQYMTILFLVVSSKKTIFHKLCMDACSKPSSIWTITNLLRSEIKDVASNGECNIRQTGQTAAVHCWVSNRIRQMITDLVDTHTPKCYSRKCSKD
jgi:hypothetical protein